MYRFCLIIQKRKTLMSEIQDSFLINIDRLSEFLGAQNIYIPPEKENFLEDWLLRNGVYANQSSSARQILTQEASQSSLARQV